MEKEQMFKVGEALRLIDEANSVQSTERRPLSAERKQEVAEQIADNFDVLLDHPDTEVRSSKNTPESRRVERVRILPITGNVGIALMEVIEDIDEYTGKSMSANFTFINADTGIVPTNNQSSSLAHGFNERVVVSSYHDSGGTKVNANVNGLRALLETTEVLLKLEH